MLKRVLITALLLVVGFVNAQDCAKSYASLSDPKAFGPIYLASGVANFANLARSTPVGKQLAACPQLSGQALDSIIQAARRKATFSDDARAGILLAVYANPGGPAELDKLRQFLRLRPWRQGFSFSSQLATDALLAQLGAPERNAKYHAYAPDEMEAAVKKYAP
jgi:hypothetical protein